MSDKMSDKLFDKTCTEALGEYWSDYTWRSENKSLRKLYDHMQKRIEELDGFLDESVSILRAIEHDQAFESFLQQDIKSSNNLIARIHKAREEKTDE